MSAFGKRGVRCDRRGKISRNRNTGEYVRKDGSCGYIWPDAQGDSKDICDDCLERDRNQSLASSWFDTEDGAVAELGRMERKGMR